MLGYERQEGRETGFAVTSLDLLPATVIWTRISVVGSGKKKTGSTMEQKQLGVQHGILLYFFNPFELTGT